MRTGGCTLLLFCLLLSCACRAGITAASWHVDATFFASADASGTVVLWKKKAVASSHRRRPSFDANSRPVDKAGAVAARQ